MALMLRAGWAGLLLAVGAWQLSTSWAGGQAAAVLVGAAVLPLLLVVAGSRFFSPASVAIAVIGLGAGAFYLVCIRNGLLPGDLLREGVPRLLAAQRPAPATPELLLPGALFAFLTGIWVGLRSLGNGMVAAPVGAVALYTAAALLTAGGADPRGVVAAAIVALSAIGWIGFGGHPGRFRPGQVSRMSLPATVLATGVALLIAPIAMAGAFDPRRLVERVGHELREPSPLPRIAAWHQLGDTELLRFTTDASAEVDLRLVALTEYSGASWSAQTKYRRIGTMADPRTRATEMAVTIGALDGPWLPSPGSPLAVSLSNVEIDADSGSLALRDDVLRPGLAYRVTSATDRPTEAQIAAATVPHAAQMQQYLGLPSPPTSFAEYAKTVTDGANTPFEKAVAIEYSVREGRRHDPAAPSGSSYARLETFLFRPAGSEVGANEGTSEQFASAFAVLARTVGLPTRIVVGFASDAPAADGTRVVRGRDARAWPEVYFSGVGWYPFDPTPLATAGPSARSEMKLSVINRLFQQVVRPSATTSPPAPAPSRSRLAAPVAQPATPVWTPGYPIGAVALAVVILVTLAGARRGRSLRHRRAGAAGAWAEMLDLLLLIGRSPPRSQPAPEIAAEFALLAPLPAGVVHPAAVHPAVIVARAGDRAAFGPPPASAPDRSAFVPQPASPTDRSALLPPPASANDRSASVPQPASAAELGDEAWRAMRAVRRAAKAAIPLRRRLTWPFDPRPLWRRRSRALPR